MIIQLVKIILFIGGAVIAIKALSRFLFPESEKEETEILDPVPEWVDGKKVTVDDLQEGDYLIRDDGVVFVYFRKAYDNEYREGVEEWLFHPPNRKDDILLGLSLEEIAELRQIQE